MRSPLISVLINNHNYGRFLEKAIESVLNQTYSHVEVVVVDDGSTDDSRRIIARYGQRIIPVLKQNGGQDSAFNAGFERSRGDIVCFLDADDWFVPTKLAQLAAAFERYPDIGWCFHSLLLEDPANHESLGRTRAFPHVERDRSKFCDFRRSMRWGRLPFYPMSTSGLCLRRPLLGQILPMPETFIPTSADRYVRIAALGLAPGYYIAEDLTVQGIHGNNVSTLNKSHPFLLERQLITCYLLRTQFPHLALYTNRMFVRGLCAYLCLKASEREPEYEPFIRKYRQLCSPVDRLLIALLRLYHYRPWRKEYSFRAAEPATAPASESVST